jgi:hypothetical protein
MRHVRGNARLTAVLGRLRTIAGAYLIASLASGFAIALGLLLLALARMLYDGHWQEAAAYTLTGLIWLCWFGLAATVLVAVFAFVPAVLAIGFAEVAHIRSATFYGCVGAIVAVPAFQWFAVGDDDTFRPLPLSAAWTAADVSLALLIVVAGLIGGLVYWIVAGSSAGDWRPPATKAAVDTAA